MHMKIRFLKTLTLDVETPRMEDTWYKTFNRWEEISVEEVFSTATSITFKTNDGNFILNVPLNAFEYLKEEKRILSF